MRDSMMRVPLASASVQCTSCFRVSGRTMGVEVFHVDVVITEVKNKMKVLCEIEGQQEIGGM